jgi:hypothetical protein
MRIIISEYIFSHGRKPRGAGRWAFEIEGAGGIFWATGTYSQAKAQAISEARRIGGRIVKVMP